MLTENKSRKTFCFLQGTLFQSCRLLTYCHKSLTVSAWPSRTHYLYPLWGENCQQYWSQIFSCQEKAEHRIWDTKKPQGVWVQSYTEVFLSCFQKWHELVKSVHVISINVCWPLFLGANDYKITMRPIFTTKQLSLHIIVWRCTLKMYSKWKENNK